MSTTLTGRSTTFRRLGFGVLAAAALTLTLLGAKPAQAGGHYHGHHGGHSSFQFFFGVPLFPAPSYYSPGYYYGGYPQVHVYRESYYPRYYPHARWHYDRGYHGKHHRHGYDCHH